MISARSLAHGFVTVALTLAAAGCGAAYAPNGTPVGGHTAVEFGGQIPVTLFNDTGSTVCFVRMAPSASQHWGDDWLGSEETVPSGAERTFGVAGGASWNIRVEACNGGVISQTTGVALTGATRMPISTLRPAVDAVQLAGGKPPVAVGPRARAPWAGASSGGRAAPPIAPSDQYPTAPGLAAPTTY